MTTVTTKKTTIQPTWTPDCIREASARAMANNYCAAMSTLSKYGEQAINEFETSTRTRKVDYYRSLGVRSPLYLTQGQC